MIQIKRIYEQPEENDGLRILVDRLWPRGLSAKDADVDLWEKDLAPSDNLRKWFNHEPKKWSVFKKKYFRELKTKTGLLKRLSHEGQRKTVTLLYAAKNEELNNAVALKEYLENGRQAPT